MPAQFGLPGWLIGALLIPIAEWRLGVSIDRMSPVDAISSVKCPVFILGGEEDVDTKPLDTQRLFAAAPDPKELWIVPGARHVDLYGFAKAEYEHRLMEFIRKAETGRLETNPNSASSSVSR
jgi:pimeloyl-ACP methyl ester carboxylesterase